MKLLISILALFSLHATAGSSSFTVTDEYVTQGCSETTAAPAIYQKLRVQKKVKIVEINKMILSIELTDPVNEYLVLENKGNSYFASLSKDQFVTVVAVPNGYELELMENSRCRRYLKFGPL